MSEAKIRITAKDDSAAAFKKAITNVNSLKAGVDGLSSGFTSGIIGGLSVAGLVGFAKSALDSIDALNDLKDATGASIENISALEDIAARTGTKFDTVGSSLIKFNSILNSADPDSGASAALKAIGLEADRLKQLDPAEALRQTAVALDQFADDGNKARIVQELFGKSVKDVAPFLKDLAGQTQLLGSVTTKQAEAAEAFNKQLFAMQKTAADLARTLVSSMLPSITAINQEMEAGIRLSGGFLKAILTIGTTNPFQNTAQNLTQYRTELAELEAKRAKMGPTQAAAEGEATDAAIKKARVRIAYFKELQANAALLNGIESQAETRRLGGGSAGLPSIGNVPGKPKAAGGGRTTSAGPRQSEADRYLETLQRQFEKTQELSTVDQLLLDIQKGRLGKVSTGQQAQLLRLAEQLDGVKAQTEAEKRLAEAIKETSAAQEDFFASVMRADDAKQNQIANLLNDTPTANLEKQRSDVQLLTAEFESGRISESLYLEAVTSRLDLAADKMKTTKTLAEDLNLSFTSAFEDAIVGGKGLSEVLSGLEADILRIITRKLVTEPLGNAITGALGGAGGFNPGNFIAGLFSADGGGYTGGGPRSGGVDGKGGFMAVLHPQETVVDHTRGQTLGKSNTVNLVVNQAFAPNTSRATTMQAASDARRQLEYAGRNL